MALKFLAVMFLASAVAFGYGGYVASDPYLSGVSTIIMMLSFIMWKVADIAEAMEGDA